RRDRGGRSTTIMQHVSCGWMGPQLQRIMPADRDAVPCERLLSPTLSSACALKVGYRMRFVGRTRQGETIRSETARSRWVRRKEGFGRAWQYGSQKSSVNGRWQTALPG